MSNSIIPHLLSDSPPPIAGNIDEDYDDEFGDFTGPADFSFDNENSTPSTPKNSKQESHAFELNSSSCQLKPDDSFVDTLEHELPTKNFINILDHIENNISKLGNSDVEILEEKITYDKEILLIPQENSENEILELHIDHEERNTECNGLKKNFEPENCIPKEGFNYEDSNRGLDLSQEILAKNELCETYINEDARNAVELDSMKEISQLDDLSKDYNDNSINKIGIKLETAHEEKTRDIEIDEVKVTQDNEEGIHVSNAFAELELNDTDWNFGDSKYVPIEENEVLENSDISWHLNAENKFIRNVHDNHEHSEINQIPQKNNTPINEILNHESNSDEFDEFADFTSFKSTIKDSDFQNSPSTEQEANQINETDIDEFADFENHSSFNQLDDKNDDFDDFSSYSTCANNKPQDELACKNPKEALEKSKILFKKMFTCQEFEVDDYLQCDFTTENSVFQNLKDVTETNAVSYQWEKSTARKNLLKTLNIDIRNILYGPSWNASIPIFAANLCSTPLEPIRTDLPLQTTPIRENQTPPDSSSVPTVVPMAEFDWNSSGLSNPLSSFENTDIDPATAEPTDEIRSSPVEELDKWRNIPVKADNSSDEPSEYQMVNDTLVEDDFSDFASCQPNTEVESDWSRTILPLRESHISFQSSNNMNENSKPIIENTSTFYNLDLDLLEPKNVSQRAPIPPNEFKEFELFESESDLYLERKESKSPDVVSKGEDSDEISLPQSSSAGSFDIPDPVVELEDEFSDFHSSMPPQPELTKQHSSLPQVLEPAVLQPTQVNHQPVTRIEWPEPGLDEEEVNRIVLGCLSKTPNVEKTCTEPKQNTHNADDDEWSDFVSVKGSVKSRTSTPDLPLSVFNLGNILPVKTPAPLITPNGIMCSPVKVMSPDIISKSKTTRNYPQQHPFITSQAFEALNSRKNVTSFKSSDGASTSIQPNRNGNLQYDNYQSSNQLVTNTEDDDWGDFVSASNVPSSTNNLNPVQSSSHIFTNPSHNMAALNKKAPTQQYFNSRSTVVRQEKQNIPTISALPDLDFVSPRTRSMRK